MNDQNKDAKKVYVVDRRDSPRPEQAKPGDVVISKTQFRKVTERRADQTRTLIAVCRWCWLDGHGQHRANAQAGTMKKDKSTGLYEHLDYCAGKKDRDDAILGIEK